MTKEDFYNIAKTHFENSKIVAKEEFDTTLDIYANENSAMPWAMTETKMPDHDGLYLVIHREPCSYFDICAFSKKKEENLYIMTLMPIFLKLIIPKRY